MNLLESLVRATSGVDSMTRLDMIDALGAMLREIPAFANRAKELLLFTATADDITHSGGDKVRYNACRALKPVLKDPAVDATLTRIATADHRVPLRAKVLSILDGIESSIDELQVLMAKKVIESFDLENLSFPDLRTLEDFLWSKFPYSARALEELGEAPIANCFCAKICKEQPQVGSYQAFHGYTPLGGASATSSPTAPYYSILKFMALYTKNEDVFNQVVETLVKVAEGKDLGLLQSLPDVLAQLRANASFSLPPEIAKLIPAQVREEKEKPGSAFLGSPVREKEYDAWVKREADMVLTIIQSSDSVETIRLLALRYSVKYLFSTTYDWKWVHNKYAGFAEKLWDAIAELATSPNTPATVKTDAARILKWREHV